jgi:hypothetical protein
MPAERPAPAHRLGRGLRHHAAPARPRTPRHRRRAAHRIRPIHRGRHRRRRRGSGRASRAVPAGARHRRDVRVRPEHRGRQARVGRRLHAKRPKAQRPRGAEDVHPDTRSHARDTDRSHHARSAPRARRHGGATLLRPLRHARSCALPLRRQKPSPPPRPRQRSARVRLHAARQRGARRPRGPWIRPAPRLLARHPARPSRAGPRRDGSLAGAGRRPARSDHDAKTNARPRRLRHPGGACLFNDRGRRRFLDAWEDHLGAHDDPVALRQRIAAYLDGLEARISADTPP